MIEPERLDYPLTADSLVWDVGAYRGEFVAAILNRYGCKVMAFEPVLAYYDALPVRTGLMTFDFGLSDRNETVSIDVAGDRTSRYSEAVTEIGWFSERKAQADFRDVVGVLHSLGIAQVDLAKINIEGGEYVLLRRLLDAGYISRFRHLQVQFHTFIPEFGEKYLAIKKDLERTHTLSWRRPWIWESWQRRK